MSLDAALQAAKRGWAVFPVDHPDLPQCVGIGAAHNQATCTERGKHPAVKWSTAATTDPQVIAAEWSGRYRNVGIACGPSGLLVIDEDKPGEFARWAADHGHTIPATDTVRTGKGRHYYFRQNGTKLGNEAGAFKGLGIDVRGCGGFVLAPGSAHASGATYTAENDLDPQTLPTWIAEAVAGQVDGLKTVRPPFELPDRIPAGKEHGGLGRDETLWRYACSLRGRGATVTVAAVSMREAWKRCEQPPGDEYTLKQALEKIDRAWGYDYAESAQLAGDEPSRPLHTVTLQQFAAVEEEGGDPLLGDRDQALIPEDADVMIYGDGGAGKTTLAIDLAAHWAAGDDWLGIHISRPLACLLIENEGPRPLFRRKVNRKLTGWRGSDLGDRARVLDEPWAGFTLADPTHRQQLADTIRRHNLDVVIVGPLVCAGMEAAGTLQETREFQKLLGDVRRQADRRVAFILIHHENRAGKVSGAWEGTGDTLLHVTGMGRGKTRLHVQKARWASDYHASTLNLAWTEGDGFKVEDKPEITEDDLAAAILDAVGRLPGTGWTAVEKATPGVAHDRRRKVRDRLLTDGQLVNIGKEGGAEVWLTECPERKAARLYLPDDPTIRHLRPDSGADGAQSAPAWGEAG